MLSYNQSNFQDVAGHIPGMPGIFISCVFSASLSTVSASLHAVSGIIYSDYVRPLKWFAHTDANANLSLRILIFSLGSFCAFGGIFVERFGSIFQIIFSVAGTTIGAKFGVFTLGMLYPWANQKVNSVIHFKKLIGKIDCFFQKTKGALSGVIISFAVVLSIVMNAQYYIAQGKFHYDIIPTSIDKCSNETLAHIPSAYVF